MAFTDPQSVTVNAVAQSLPRVSAGPLASVYRKDTGDYVLTISRDERNKGRTRFSVRLDAKKVAADVYTTANNLEYKAQAYLVIDMPNVGYSPTEIKDITLALTAWAGSANLLKVIGREN